MATRAGSRPPRKIFHKIGEVCDLTKTEPYVLRYWESEFPFLAPEKNRAGQRIYTDDDIETVLAIKRLLYEEGYTTAGARRRLEKEREDGAGPPAVPGESSVTALTAAPAEPPTPAAPQEAGGDGLRRVLAEVRDGLLAIRASLSAPLLTGSPSGPAAAPIAAVQPPVAPAAGRTKAARPSRRSRK